MKEYQWIQDLFDLMCNERIKLTVEGEIGEVSASLEICNLHGECREIANVMGAEDFVSATRELMEQAQENL